MSAGLTQTKITDYVRKRLARHYNTAIADGRLTYRMLLEELNSVQQEISSFCCLIKTCYHWVVVAGTSFYGLELTPALFVKPYVKRFSCYWKGTDGQFRALKWRDDITLEQLAATYTTNATPQYACLTTQSGAKAVAILPAPDTSAGDGTKANDPLRFYAWRVAKPIESTSGVPEIDGDLHELLKQGTLARAAAIVEHPSADLWEQKYQLQLASRRVVDGIRRPCKSFINNVYEGVLPKEILLWDGLYEPGMTV